MKAAKEQYRGTPHQKLSRAIDKVYDEIEETDFSRRLLLTVGDEIESVVPGALNGLRVFEHSLSNEEFFSNYLKLQEVVISEFRNWNYTDTSTSCAETIQVSRFRWLYVNLLRKVNVPDESQKNLEVEALERYLNIEEDLSLFEGFDSDVEDIARLAQNIVSETIGPYLWLWDTAFGPGATVEVRGRNIDRSAKYSHLGSYDAYPELDPIPLEGDDPYPSLTESFASRLTFVPKDRTKVRTINIEPTNAIWRQKALGNAIREALSESPYFVGDLADQTVNSRQAKLGSLDRSCCTIDLSDASDRLSREAVRLVLGDQLADVIDTLRSSQVVLPDGRVHELRKSSSMGNGACFEVQTLAYWAVCVATLIRLGYKRARAFSSVYVYGDDIIVPDTAGERVVEVLQKLGLVVNKAKSFLGSTIPFRESCGGHYLCGTDVTPIYLRTVLPAKKPKIDTLLDVLTSVVSTANQLRRYGLEMSAESLYEIAEQFLGRLPDSTLLQESGEVPLTRVLLWWENFDTRGKTRKYQGSHYLVPHWHKSMKPIGLTFHRWGDVAHIVRHASQEDRGVKYRPYWTYSLLRVR